MTYSTLTKNLKSNVYYQSYDGIEILDDKSKSETGKHIKVTFLPAQKIVTPLKVYEKELQKAGYPHELIAEIIEGLAESPLYESKKPKQ